MIIIIIIIIIINSLFGSTQKNYKNGTLFFGTLKKDLDKHR